jgi:PAS domain S-box-containing protein
MARVQLLVGDEQNRRLLAETLERDHEVVDGADSAAAFLDTEFDLCVLDARALRGHRETLAEKKDRAAPVFLPYLLLLGDREDGTGGLWDDVDEVIETPVQRGALRNRVSNLLERRTLSLRLKRRQEVTEQRFRTLFESTPDPIVVVTDDGVVTEVNDAFTRMFGVDRAAVLDTHVGDIDATPADSVERLLLRVEEPPAAENTVEVESLGGDTHVTELNVDVVEEFGEATERIGIFRDVTSRERHQRELERQIEQLERFAAVISHDLRDPLNTARAKLQLARRECDSEKLVELGDVLDRMEHLIEDVLTLAKQGKAVGETEAVDLGTAAEAAWSTVVAPEAATLRTEPGLPVADADPERLRAMLENLFRNAVVHAGPDVRMTVGPLDGRHGFYVADDGTGIPESEREDVFEYGHTTAEEGSGLGLAIVRQVAEAHGWTVSLSDSETGGARFEFGFR